MLAIVAGDPEVVQKLANKNAAMALRQRQNVPVLAIRRYLRNLKNDYEFLTQLESALGIGNLDYKNLRRAISDYPKLGAKRKQITATRLIQALKAKLSGTDLQRQAQIFADKQRLELDREREAERTVPGKELTPDEMSGYRLLVGASNVRRAKVAADMVKQGRAVPAPIMAAYAPVITMIDDITKGGYTFVKLLQTIHDRARTKIRRSI
jgi:hypothetical protein